jgi:hypothetical protein
MDVICTIYIVVINHVLILWSSFMKVVSGNHHTITKNVEPNLNYFASNV